MLRGVLPFSTGKFEGTGHWINQTTEGDYTVACVMEATADGGSEHTVHRVFLKPDGATLYEEDSRLTFIPAERNGFRVVIRSAQGEVHGSGYYFDDQCHYEADIAHDNRLEWTFTVRAEGIEGLASSTNRGNFTSWKEVLRRV